ncbi:DUF559 domain-containing protein [Hungatella hathewayi]|uniref:DUF559 domain-containing protein n=1 Tax=Hungatella hathewayi TaxID=154046 RepID=UPI0035649324
MINRELLNINYWYRLLGTNANYRTIDKFKNRVRLRILQLLSAHRNKLYKKPCYNVSIFQNEITKLLLSIKISQKKIGLNDTIGLVYTNINPLEMRRYNCDIIIESLKLVIEIDGSFHTPEDDIKKTKDLQEQGYTVIRIRAESLRCFHQQLQDEIPECELFYVNDILNEKNKIDLIKYFCQTFEIKDFNIEQILEIYTNEEFFLNEFEINESERITKEIVQNFPQYQKAKLLVRETVAA